MRKRYMPMGQKDWLIYFQDSNIDVNFFTVAVVDNFR